MHYCRDILEWYYSMGSIIKSTSTSGTWCLASPSDLLVQLWSEEEQSELQASTSLCNLNLINCRLMVFCSWMVSGVLSCPQAILFRKVKHPKMDFYQCTPIMFLETYSHIVIKDNRISFSFYGIDPKIIYTFYHFSFLFFVYFLPLTIMIISFTSIIRMLRR